MTFDKRDLLAYMRGHRLAVVSTVGASGAPEGALVGIAVSPQHEIIFDTVTDSRKHANLARDGRTAFVFAGPGERTLQIEGIARPIPVAGPADEDLRQLYYAVWPDGRQRLSLPTIAYWGMSPRWARYSDFAAGPLVRTFEWRAA